MGERNESDIHEHNKSIERLEQLRDQMQTLQKWDGLVSRNWDVVAWALRRWAARRIEQADLAAEQIAELEAERRELVEALRDCVGVMLERVYPKPDAPDSHPWNVTRRGQDLLEKIDAQRSDAGE